MTRNRKKAVEEFRRMVKWIGLTAVLMVVAALSYLGSQGDLHLHVVVATILGVFFSTLLGCGLFALAFFSDKSGHDDNVTESTRRENEDRPS